MANDGAMSPNESKIQSIRSLAWERETAKDVHGRPIFPKERSEDFHSPIVSEALAGRFIDLEYPGKKDFAVVLTHDVDLLVPSMPRRMVNACNWAGKGRLSDSISELHRSGHRPHPYSDLKSIAKMEEKKGASSTFFVLNSPKDHTGAGYSIKDISGQLDSVKSAGCEIALHGSYDASQSASKILEEKAGIERELNVKVVGYRNHYLRFQVPSSFQKLEEVGIKYDSTIGFADNYGFRNGMVHPYHPSLGDSGTSSILELPLAVMDCALYSYMGLMPGEGRTICEDLIGQTKKLHGTLVILWHNTSFVDPRLLEWGDLYWHILDKAKEEGAWLCSGAELSNWWEINGR
jgi:hypothetical protein